MCLRVQDIKTLAAGLVWSPMLGLTIISFYLSPVSFANCDPVRSGAGYTFSSFANADRLKTPLRHPHRVQQQHCSSGMDTVHAWPMFRDVPMSTSRTM